MKHALASVLSTLLVAAAGCGETRTTGSDLAPSPAPDRTAGSTADSPDAALDLGDDWDQSLLPRGRAATARGSAAPSAPWAVVLGTFSREGHAKAARTMAEQVRVLVPALAAVRVHPVESGSMVVYGAYESPADERARGDLQRIKGTTVEGRAIFGKAILSRVSRPEDVPAGRYDLRHVRTLHPDVDPLYTLQVALWGDFGSGQLSVEQTRRKAEGYVAELRARGIEAYVDHDADRRLSVVTVGLFDRTALDSETGLYGAEVQAMLKRFPEHLVNGEPLREPIDRFRPSRGTRVQAPRLVEVPKE